MSLLSKRRWLRFSVRTLLIAVTILCVWLGWQVSIVQDRRAMIKRIEADGDGGYVQIVEVLESESSPANRPYYDAYRVSNFRSLLGDKTVTDIILDGEMQPADMKEIERLFPEATIRVIGRVLDMWRRSPYAPAKIY